MLGIGPGGKNFRRAPDSGSPWLEKRRSDTGDAARRISEMLDTGLR
jgi:hypothetical protein